MSLRKYINELEILFPFGIELGGVDKYSSKRINCSSPGKWFENGDFARSIELTANLIKKDVLQKSDCNKRLVGCGMGLLFPITTSIAYGSVKMDKILRRPCYEKFYSDSGLILNH